MKLLMWLGLGLLVYLALRSHFHRKRSQFERDHFNSHSQGANSGQPSPPIRRAGRSSTPVETMVACSWCQIYLPASEATVTQKTLPVHYFCCEEHARLYSQLPKPPVMPDE